MNDAPTPSTTIYICTSCRLPSQAPEPREERAGARLHIAVADAAVGDPSLVVRGVECLSVCKRPVTVGFASAGKWTYVYGDFGPEHVDSLLDGARKFAATPDGLIPWKERPEALKRGVVARLPPG